MRVFLVILLFCLTSFRSLSQCGDSIPAAYPLGANLNGLSDWNLDRPFNDAFISNRGFSKDLDAPWNYIAISTDSNGWPLEDFSVIVMSLMEDQPATYSISFNGQATITPIACSFTVQDQQYDSLTNTTTANLVYASNPDQQMDIKFTQTKFATGIGGIKNIHIYNQASVSTSSIFSQPFLDHLSRFKVLRFMNWSHTNGNEDSVWTDRTLLSTAAPLDTAHINHGIAWEYCIALANTLKKDIWINIPHKATDDYVTQLATLIHNTLDPSLKIYIEYSNELWNFTFSQAQWNLQEAIIEANAGDPINYDQVDDIYTWHYRRIAERGKQISAIFRSVFDNEHIGNQLRPIYAVQVGYYDVGQRGLEFINNYYGPPNQYFYGLAGAPYFNSSAADTANTASSSGILNALQIAMNSLFTGAGNNLNQYAALSHYYSLFFTSYEGGPDTSGPDNVNAKLEATEDTATKSLCINYLKNWYAYDPGGLFMWFTAGAGSWNTAYGSFPITQHYENSEKLQAIDSIRHMLPGYPTAGNYIPGTIDARKFEGYPSNWNQSPAFIPSWMPYTQYLMNVPEGKAGLYRFAVECGYSNSGSNSFKVSIDNQLLDSLIIPSNNNGFNTYTLGNIYLKEGIHTLRYTASTTGNNYQIGNFIASLVRPCSISLTDSLISTTQSIQVFPNPAVQQLTISTTGLVLPVAIKMFDMTGRLIYSGQQLTENMKLDIGNLPNAVYCLKIGTILKKFVKM